MFDASSAFSAPLYRSVAMAPSQAPAPFEPFQLQHQQVNQHQAKFMTPLQAPSFSKKHMELPPSMEEVPVKAFEAPMLVAAEVPVSASSSNNCKCPSMPTYVEPHSHFFCTSALAAASLFERVVSELRALHDCDDSAAAASSSSSQLERTIMDCAPVAGRFLVEVTAYASASGRACPFVVHLYDATARKGANQFCVEFQRADSAPQCDRRHFFHLFNAARARIQAAFPTKGEAAPQQQQQQMQQGNLQVPSLLMPPCLRSWSAPPLPLSACAAAAAVSSSTDVMALSLRSLLSMLESDCLDVQLQGALALAEMSACVAASEDALKEAQRVHAALVKERVCETFMSLLSSSNHAGQHSQPTCPEVLRASLFALANVAGTQDELCRRIVGDERGFASLLALVRSHSNDAHEPGGNDSSSAVAATPCVQQLRDCVRFLSNCASRLGSAGFVASLPAVHQTGLAHVVHSLTDHADAHCRKHAQIIAEKLCFLQQQQQNDPLAASSAAQRSTQQALSAQ
jgi:hypothetical protein